jgi:cytochrome c peroxidase
MHNGLFSTLEDVIDFYNDGGGAGIGLDIENQTLASDPLDLTDLEKVQLIDFLHSLTDTSGLDPGHIVLPTFKNQPYWNQRGKPIIID